MKTTLKALMILALAVSLNTELQAQGIKIPQASSAQTITQSFGLGKINVSYSRPNTKGRKVFGGMEPFDKVWRTGANSATSITFSDPVKIGGQELAAGTYGLFTIPGKDEWTVIFNKDSKQWGAYEYKEAEDVLRIKVKPVKLKEKVETFTIQFANVFPTTAKLQLSWENTGLNIDLSTDIDAQVMASIDEAMKAEKKPYFAAAQYYFENGKDLNKALEWINAAEAADPKAPWVRLWKGRIQLKKGDKAGAIASAEAGIKLATEAKVDEYVRLNSALLAEAKK
ncbi:hypothetical protein AQ505_21095 [Pedobacter sp. PACM 27299]|uniref:DUF2911 domain-containing protein n=1 Tax=Pedobacter sp. PACM 27299 TaxID=1727164 RepID=UPI0007063376|nr:DUF2911 domain-containing protein [Pedobacter sp. PACM 27299]ALL07771.1 hypothetical protein AQ505_21095 [Pedobacter sp. PACM 27299]